MRKIGAIILLLFGLLPTHPAEAARGSVLVIHDAGAAARPREQQALDTLLDLLCHFDYRVSSVSADAYRSGELHSYEATIYLGLRESTELPEELLTDCYDSERTVCWIGAGLDQLADRFSLGRYGFQLDAAGPAARPSRVAYRERHYHRTETPLARIVVSRPDACQVLAVAKGDGELLPYAVRSGKFWYFPDPSLLAPNQAGSHLVFCDQLHEVLAERHPVRRRALLCIAEVSGETDARPLGDLIKYLEGQGLPFAISVIPVLRDAAGDREIRVSRKRGLVGVLRGAQRNGASVIADGLVGRPSGRNAAGEAARDLPQEGAASQAPGEICRRMEEALSELATCGLYPLAWVRPRGLAAGDANAEGSPATGAADLFSTMWQRRPARETQAAGPPFLIDEDRRGQRLIPDNLATLHEGRGQAEAVLAAVERHEAIPDPWVTASILPSAPVRPVELLVNGLREMGYEFADLRHMQNWTRGGSLHIYSVATRSTVRELIPEGWDATVTGSEPGEVVRFERVDRDGREEAEVHPGALLIAYAPGQRPRPMFAFEGRPQAAAHRVVYDIAHLVVFVGLAACGVLTLIYLVQVIAQRRW